MGESNSEREGKLFEQYISSRKILVADGSASARTGVSALLMQMGARSTHLHMAKTLDAAHDVMKAEKPQLVLADYELGGGRGLELLQAQRRDNPESQSAVFILLTGNSSQSAVARAAEEEVDGFLLKPFTPEVLRQTVIRTAVQKVHPPEYVKEIQAGRALLVKGDIPEAEKKFTAASKLDSKPSLAHAYLGQTGFIKKLLQESEVSYETGLGFNRIHYKCMVGLYDLMMEQKYYDRAYEVVKKVSQYFPANPKRLTEVLRLAIINQKYDDVEKYYQIFCGIDARDETLINYVCAALVVCGKHYLKANNRARALELFQKAGATSAGRTKILREIILSLIECKMAVEAKTFLERFPQDLRSQPEYLLLEFQVVGLQRAPSDILSKGWELIGKGVADPKLYLMMIRAAVEGGSTASVENLVHDASTKYPDQAAHFSEAAKQGASDKA